LKYTLTTVALAAALAAAATPVVRDSVARQVGWQSSAAHRLLTDGSEPPPPWPEGSGGPKVAKTNVTVADGSIPPPPWPGGGLDTIKVADGSIPPPPWPGGGLDTIKVADGSIPPPPWPGGGLMSTNS
jgi:hypothetical protein